MFIDIPTQTKSSFWNKMCSLDRGTSHWRQNRLVPVPRKLHWCQTQLWLQTPSLSGASYHQGFHGTLSPNLASGKPLIIPTEEKQTDLDENTMAECGSFDTFCLLIACFPSSFVLSVWCSWSKLFPSYWSEISSLFLHWFLPYFEALFFPLTQLLLCPEECSEFFL